MNLEIERKFLLKNVPALKYDDEKSIAQYYVWSEEKNNFDRYRSARLASTDVVKYFHTYKNRISSTVSEEHEREITQQEFLFKTISPNSLLLKKRKIYKTESLVWEIDIFDSVKLIIAEVELPYENCPIEIPEEIKKELLLEVTEYPQFINSNLATKLR